MVVAAAGVADHTPEAGAAHRVDARRDAAMGGVEGRWWASQGYPSGRYWLADAGPPRHGVSGRVWAGLHCVAFACCPVVVACA